MTFWMSFSSCYARWVGPIVWQHGDCSIVPGPCVSLPSWCLGTVTTLNSGWLMRLSSRCLWRCGGQIAGLKVGNLTVLRCWQQTLTAGQVHEPVCSKTMCWDVRANQKARPQPQWGGVMKRKAKSYTEWYNNGLISKTEELRAPRFLAFHHDGVMIGIHVLCFYTVIHNKSIAWSVFLKNVCQLFQEHLAHLCQVRWRKGEKGRREKRGRTQVQTYETRQ